MIPQRQNERELRTIVRVARALDRIEGERERGRVAYLVWRAIDRRDPINDPAAAKIVRDFGRNVFSSHNREFAVRGIRTSYIKPYFRPDGGRTLPKALRLAVLERDGRCQFCGAVERLSVDHIHPVILGGTDDLENLQVLCIPCNSRKGARLTPVAGTIATEFV